tara:strand:+ start:404 stop:574 length:171 start_codon:yes stop_codon:yes gene_type:complete
MKELEISIKESKFPDLLKDKPKILCNKCGGSGNIKSPENIRKTCLICFGRGYEISQ